MEIKNMTKDFDTNTYETPSDFYDRCHKEFRFQVDAAAEPKTAKCRKFVTKEQNVLNMTFRNKVLFCNPPYNDSKAPMKVWAEWCSRMCHKYGNTVVLLAPSSTDTFWWHEIVMKEAAEIRNIKGRIHFVANGVEMKQTKHQNSLIIFRPGVKGAALTSMEARIKVCHEKF